MVLSQDKTSFGHDAVIFPKFRFVFFNHSILEERKSPVRFRPHNANMVPSAVIYFSRNCSAINDRVSSERGCLKGNKISIPEDKGALLSREKKKERNFIQVSNLLTLEHLLGTLQIESNK